MMQVLEGLFVIVWVRDSFFLWPYGHCTVNKAQMEAMQIVLLEARDLNLMCILVKEIPFVPSDPVQLG